MTTTASLVLRDSPFFAVTILPRIFCSDLSSIWNARCLKEIEKQYLLLPSFVGLKFYTMSLFNREYGSKPISCSHEVTAYC